MSNPAERKIFSYPDGRRMCASGQRRAALTALELTLPGAEGVKEGILRRALIGEKMVRNGGTANKHDLIAFVVADLVTGGGVEEYVDTETGDYTLNTFDGRSFPNNILADLVGGKHIF